jgi:hypothetical protein
MAFLTPVALKAAFNIFGTDALQSKNIHARSKQYTGEKNSSQK